MKHLLTRIFLLRKSLVLFFTLLVAQGFSQTPATLMGIVTNCVTGNPVIGAVVTVGNASTYSVFGGVYSLSVTPPGTYNVTCSKSGFDVYHSSPVVFGQGATVNLPICLNESANPPAQVVAVVDSSVSPSMVNISWQVPRGDYELLYDDGTMEDFTMWSLGGNMNAVKFTPLGYPVTVTGGKINIGTLANYPPGSTPLVPFQVSVYDASGSGGVPGVKIAGPVDVIPTNFGWVVFSFSSGPVINSGNFYLVMTQGGNAPNAAGLAIDETSLQYRSYSKQVTSGATSWVSSSGNFMIRALVYGSGGPPSSMDVPLSATQYTVSRLRQGEEQNPQIWTLVGTTTSTQINDHTWPVLPCGPYRWASQAVYSGNRVSEASFSDVIGKCWTVNTTVKVTLSCDSSSMKGITVSLANLVYPDTLYVKQADTLGTAFFPKFWKGTYELKVSRFGYQDFIHDYSISNDTVFHVFLLQKKVAPTDLFVNDSSLIANWSKPLSSEDLFKETWQSGSFSTNAWSVQGQNWRISSGIGDPMPSVMFSWSPEAINYSETITSKPITGQNSSVLRLKYDIFLKNFGTTSLNQMATEIWDGSSWNLLRNYTNAQGSIPWTHQDLDISTYTGLTFKIRFRAYGVDSYDIYNWNIDNIIVTGRESSSGAGACVLGYNVYLENILCGYTADTFYQIPPSLVNYGYNFNACVSSVYGSGTSALDCYSFTSWYLPPPENLVGTGIVSSVHLSWNKPADMMKGRSPAMSDPPGLIGYIVFRDGVFLDSIKNADILTFTDNNLYPGTYSYKVTAYYNLNSYGHPGTFAQSYPAGPVSIEIIYGHLLPFTETWDEGNFNTNQWTFDPDAGNWSINNNVGNPAPCAQFSWTPPRTNYSYALVSPVLNASSVNCANIWLDFDYRLLNGQATGNEKMNVEAFYDNTWHGLAEFSNTGSTSWISNHLDISPVKAQAFSIRFRASGKNSQNIISWSIDNIHVYGVCKPPKNLAAEFIANNVQLNWSPPVCEDGHPLHEGFEETFFPPTDWTQVITNSNASWKQTNSTTPPGVHSGQHAARVNSDYSHQDEWLIAHDIQITGNLEFWSYAFQGSTHSDHYYVKISEDDGTTWTNVLDMSALPPYPSMSGYNDWSLPYIVDLSSHIGQVLEIAWQAVDGDGLGLWYSWLIDDCSVGTKKLFLPASPQSDGYNVFRQDFGSGNFHSITPNPVTDTSYLDRGLVSATYRYYVTAFDPYCSVNTSSDTVSITVITGISSQPEQVLNIFPNPATDMVTIKSSTGMTSIDIFNYIGQKIYTNSSLSVKEYKLNVSDFQPGVYFFRIKTEITVQTVKVSIIK